MELLRDAEPVVEASADLFEEVGLGSFANSLRSELPLATLEKAFAVCAVLQNAQLKFVMDVGLNAGHDAACELAFWAEGAILAACDGEIDLFNDCLTMVGRIVMVEGPAFSVH